MQRHDNRMRFMLLPSLSDRHAACPLPQRRVATFICHKRRVNIIKCKLSFISFRSLAANLRALVYSVVGLSINKLARLQPPLAACLDCGNYPCREGEVEADDALHHLRLHSNASTSSFSSNSRLSTSNSQLHSQLQLEACSLPGSGLICKPIKCQFEALFAMRRRRHNVCRVSAFNVCPDAEPEPDLQFTSKRRKMCCRRLSCIVGRIPCNCLAALGVYCSR